MATLKFYLDKRYKNQVGNYPLRLRVSSKGDGAFINTDIRLKENQWDAVKQIATGVENKRVINSYLRTLMVQCENAVMELKMKGALRGKSVKDIRDLIERTIKGENEKRYNFVEFFESVMENKKDTTKIMYAHTLNKLKELDSKLDSLYLDDINPAYINKLINKLNDAGLKQNTIKIHISHMKSVMNTALEEELITHNAFKGIKVKKSQVVHRTMSVEELRGFFGHPTNKIGVMCVDMFKLMFLLIGINAKDLFNLRYEDIQDGRINFYRAKTKKLYSIKIEPEAKELMDKYKGKERALNLFDKYSCHNSFMGVMNHYLKQYERKLSTYYSRHSWATIAHEIGIDKDTISLALGHSFGVSVTDTYIDYNAEKVDEANRKVIDWVLYNKKA